MKPNYSHEEAYTNRANIKIFYKLKLFFYEYLQAVFHAYCTFL